MKRSIAVILLATASVAWGQCGQTTKAPCLVLGQRDVPAVEYTTPASYPCNVNMCSGGACLASCLTMPEVHWKCEDKSRILLTAEDGKHWCHLPEIDYPASRSRMLDTDNWYSPLAQFGDPGINKLFPDTGNPAQKCGDGSFAKWDSDEGRYTCTPTSVTVTVLPKQPATSPDDMALIDPGTLTLTPTQPSNDFLVVDDDALNYLNCTLDAVEKSFTKCEFSGTMTLEKALWIVFSSERNSNDFAFKQYSEIQDNAQKYIASSKRLVAALDAQISDLKRQNARLKAELAAAKKGSAKR